MYKEAKMDLRIIEKNRRQQALEEIQRDLEGLGTLGKKNWWRKFWLKRRRKELAK